MSELGYQEKLRLKIASPDKGVCEIAAPDRISPVLDVSTRTYLAKAGYEIRAEEGFKTQRDQNTLMAELYDMIAGDLGLDDRYDIGFEHASTLRELVLLLRHLFVDGNLVVVDIDAQEPHTGNPDDEVVSYGMVDNPHSMGLLPMSIGCHMLFEGRSTWLPPEAQGILTPDDVYELLVHHNDRYLSTYRFNDANITYYPMYIPPSQSKEQSPGRTKWRILDAHRRGRSLDARTIALAERRHFKHLQANDLPVQTATERPAPTIPSRNVLR